MIVDTGADLNVYLETGEDGKKKGSCCAPAATGGCDGAGAAPAPPVGGSCAPADLVPEKTDLNEFVGKCVVTERLNRVGTRSQLTPHFYRLLQDLRCQELKRPFGKRSQRLCLPT